MLQQCCPQILEAQIHVVFMLQLMSSWLLHNFLKTQESWYEQQKPKTKQTGCSTCFISYKDT